MRIQPKWNGRIADDVFKANLIVDYQKHKTVKLFIADHEISRKTLASRFLASALQLMKRMRRKKFIREPASAADGISIYKLSLTSNFYSLYFQSLKPARTSTAPSPASAHLLVAISGFNWSVYLAFTHCSTVTGFSNRDVGPAARSTGESKGFNTVSLCGLATYNPVRSQAH